MSAESAAGSAYLWPVRLAAGVSRGNLLTLYYAAFVSIGFISLLNFLQPYILIENLQIPKGEQGAVTGQLGFVSELTMICLGLLIGAFSDRVGRNALFTLGLVLLAAGYAGLGHVANLPQMFGLRLLLAVGACLAGVMLTSTQTDYPQEADRGKLLGIAALVTALGVTVAVVLAGQLPAMFRAQGYTAVEAGRLAMYGIAGVAMASALVVRLGLKRGRPAVVSGALSLRQVIRDGLVSGRNSRIVLCYLAAFVSRSDMTVVGLYFSLWITTTGVEQGLSTADALGKATLLFSVMNLASLVWAPIMGIIIDRLERVTALTIAVGLAAVGYGSVCLVTDPINNPWFWLWLVVLGMGVISPVLAAQALLGQETQPELRGAVNGLFSAMGAVGILAISLAGGYLFDIWKPYPFLVVAVLNLLLLGAAFWLTRLSGDAHAPR